MELAGITSPDSKKKCYLRMCASISSVHIARYSPYLPWKPSIEPFMLKSKYTSKHSIQHIDLNGCSLPEDQTQWQDPHILKPEGHTHSSHNHKGAPSPIHNEELKRKYEIWESVYMIFNLQTQQEYLRDWVLTDVTGWHNKILTQAARDRGSMVLLGCRVSCTHLI